MPETDPGEFTDREKYVIHYLRSEDLSGPRRGIISDSIYILSSVACVVFGVVREDMAIGFVGYALALGRLCYLGTGGRKATQDIRGIIRKYEARVKALTDHRRQDEIGNHRG